MHGCVWLQKAFAQQVARLTAERDEWKGKADTLRRACSGLQRDMQKLRAVARQALPNGGGFQETASMWQDGTLAGSMDAYLVRARN